MFPKKKNFFVQACNHVSYSLQKTFSETDTHHKVKFCKSCFFVKCGWDGFRKKTFCLSNDPGISAYNTSLYLFRAFMVKHSKNSVDIERKTKFSSKCLLDTGTRGFYRKMLFFFHCRFVRFGALVSFFICCMFWSFKLSKQFFCSSPTRVFTIKPPLKHLDSAI